MVDIAADLIAAFTAPLLQPDQSRLRPANTHFREAARE